MMNPIKKNVIVTGASSGIGLELVYRLLKEDYNVIAVVRNLSENLPDSKNLHVLTCDVSRPEEVDKLFDDAMSILGSIDIFIANAGFAYYEKMDTPNWQHIEKIYQTNTISAIYSAQKLKTLSQNKPFQFITTASGMGYFALPGYALYSSTKAAIRSFSHAYRYELEQGQTFQVVYPIATRTKFFHSAGDSPIPWPSQSVEVVADAIIKGIKSKKNDIYPSKIFATFLVANRILPFLSKLYCNIENNRFQVWLNRQKGAY